MHICSTKEHLDYPQEQVDPLKWKLFLTLLIQIQKNIFSKSAFFNKACHPRTLYLSKIGPVIVVM